MNHSNLHPNLPSVLALTRSVMAFIERGEHPPLGSPEDALLPGALETLSLQEECIGMLTGDLMVNHGDDFDADRDAVIELGTHAFYTRGLPMPWELLLFSAASLLDCLHGHPADSPMAGPCQVQAFAHCKAHDPNYDFPLILWGVQIPETILAALG